MSRASASRLKATSHYGNQCSLITKKALWYSPEIKFTSAHGINPQLMFEDYTWFDISSDIRYSSKMSPIQICCTLKMWNGITCPFPNVNGAAVEVWEWNGNCILHFIGLMIPCACPSNYFFIIASHFLDVWFCTHLWLLRLIRKVHRTPCCKNTNSNCSRNNVNRLPHIIFSIPVENPPTGVCFYFNDHVVIATWIAWELVTRICNAGSVPSHYLNQCCLIVS